MNYIILWNGLLLIHLIINSHWSFFEIDLSTHKIRYCIVFVFLKFFSWISVFIFFTFYFKKSFKYLMIFIKSSLPLLIRIFLKKLLFFLIFFFFFFSIILDSTFIEGLKLELSFFCKFEINERIFKNYEISIFLFFVLFFFDWNKIFLILRVFTNLTLFTDFS